MSSFSKNLFPVLTSDLTVEEKLTRKKSLVVDQGSWRMRDRAQTLCLTKLLPPLTGKCVSKCLARRISQVWWTPLSIEGQRGGVQGWRVGTDNLFFHFIGCKAPYPSLMRLHCSEIPDFELDIGAVWDLVSLDRATVVLYMEGNIKLIFSDQKNRLWHRLSSLKTYFPPVHASKLFCM